VASGSGPITSGATSLAPDRSSPAEPRTKTSRESDALDGFLKDATKTPAERAKEQILKQRGLDDEGCRKLAPDQRAQIDREIAEAV